MSVITSPPPTLRSSRDCDVLFQRESAVLYNSGVVAVHTGLAANVAVFRHAVANYVAKDGGDQKALQRAVKFARGQCAGGLSVCGRCLRTLSHS